MLFSYLTLISEVAAYIFRAIGACILLLPISGFLAFVALGRHDGLIMILGLMAAGMTAIMAAVAAYAELEQAVEEVKAFRRWRAAIQNS